MKAITIQQAAAILIERGISFTPTQPIVVDGQFVSQYIVDGQRMSGEDVKKFLGV